MNNKSLLTSNGNANKLPSLLNTFKELNNLGVYLNYGAGKHYKKHEQWFGGNLISYDPYVEEINTLPQVGTFSAVLCSNVLNVIESDEELNKTLDYFDELSKKYVTIFITIYEGDRSGIGKKTKLGTYQRNKKLKDWEELWKRGYKRASKNNNIIFK